MWRNNSFRVEAGEWQTSWYVHHQFGSGYTNKGRGLGHWFADEDIEGYNQGGEVFVVSTRMGLKDNQDLYLKARQISFHPTEAKERRIGREFIAEYQYRFKDHKFGLKNLLGKDINEQSFHTIQGYWHWDWSL